MAGDHASEGRGGALLRANDPRAALTTAVVAALLLADAWFDVCTASPGADHVIATVEALLVEVPLALTAGRLALCLLPDRPTPTLASRRRPVATPRVGGPHGG